MKIKVCGITNANIAKLCDDYCCEFVGAVFYPKSPRYITPRQAKEVFSDLKNSQLVAVVVNLTFAELSEIFKDFTPNYVQFHGDENQVFLEQFRKKFPNIGIIKAFRVSSSKDLYQINEFEALADYFLFDAKDPGAGKNFDWSCLQEIKIKKPWFLAGGLTLDNIDQAVKITKAKMIDISSSLEKIRGQKNEELIKEFFNKIKK